MAKRKYKPKYKVIEGIRYKAITSYYDGRVIGWVECPSENVKSR